MNLFPIDCIIVFYSYRITHSQDCFHGNLEGKQGIKNVSALKYPYF